jgi:hypothetical protein
MNGKYFKKPGRHANVFSSSDTICFLCGSAGTLLPPNRPSLATPSGPVWSSWEGAALQDNERELVTFCPPPAPLRKYLTGCLLASGSEGAPSIERASSLGQHGSGGGEGETGAASGGFDHNVYPRNVV